MAKPVAENPKQDAFATFLTALKKRLESIARPHIMLVTCFDLRYPALIHKHMEETENGWFHEKYDHMSLAGAGLAAVVDFPPHPKPNWSSTFMEQVAISKKLHNIGAIVVLEHRTCGAYEEFGLLRKNCTPEEETASHEAQTDRLKAAIRRDFPDILFFSFLLDAVPHPPAAASSRSKKSEKLSPIREMISFVPLGLNQG